MIPYGRQSITDEDIDAVVAVLKSDYLTQGQMVPAFEQGLADYCQAPHVIACSNGTTALHLACAALELGADEARMLVELRERDARDAARDVAPMRPADDAILLDTSEMSIEAAVARAVETVRQVLA